MAKNRHNTLWTIIQIYIIFQKGVFSSMSTRRQVSNGFWSTLAKILIFIIALYIAYFILKPLLSVLLGVGFWVIKIIVFLTVALLVHLFLKIIFEIDLLRLVFGRNWRI